MKLIDKQLLDDVSRQAQKSERLRMNYNFHQYGSWLMIHGSWLYTMAEKKSYYKKKGEFKPKVEHKPKRGKLAPLMSEEDKQNAGIHELSYDFGCRITRLFQYLTEDSEYKEYVISKQIYRSGT